jgi:hypothetical protein
MLVFAAFETRTRRDHMMLVRVRVLLVLVLWIESPEFNGPASVVLARLEDQ